MRETGRRESSGGGGGVVIICIVVRCREKQKTRDGACVTCTDGLRGLKVDSEGEDRAWASCVYFKVHKASNKL